MSQSDWSSLVVKILPEQYDYPAPDGSEIRLLPEVSGGGLAHCRLPRGGVSKAVTHQTVEEIWYCLSGRGQVWRKGADEESEVEVAPGVSLTIPRGVSFQFRTTGDGPLDLLIVTIPRWPGKHEAVAVPDHWGQA